MLTVFISPFLSQASATKAETHIGLYTKKGLITRYETLDELAKWGFWDKNATSHQLDSALKQYDGEAKKGSDGFGKKYFKNVPLAGAGPWWVSARSLEPSAHGRTRSCIITFERCSPQILRPSAPKSNPRFVRHRGTPAIHQSPGAQL